MYQDSVFAEASISHRNKVADFHYKYSCDLSSIPLRAAQAQLTHARNASSYALRVVWVQQRSPS